jgi:DNA invertase Pin-like site-specific DNA recombinase
MSPKPTNGKPLRFAALIRVSTERQAKRGESLRTQASQIEQAVALLNGKIVARYEGQEHAVAIEGYKRVKLEQLLEDAQKKPRPFDAVMVADMSRWSRDNETSKRSLRTLRDAGVLFYVLTSPYDLYSPDAILQLGIAAEMDEHRARTQVTKSILNRIERAKRELPTAGKLPFGRVWDHPDKTLPTKLVVDPDKKAMIEDVARRLLAGESLAKMAKEYGVNHSNLCKILRERCGENWSITYKSKNPNIEDHEIQLRIPRLLDERTIKAVKQRLEANRTYLHKHPAKHEYLLSGYIRCAECGYVMFGQMNHNGHRYYRHAHTERKKACPLQGPRPWVPADKIEVDVVRQLVQMLGNPAALERAIKAAVPKCDEVMKRRSQIDAELTKVEKARQRIIALVRNDTITDAQADKTLLDLKEREADLRTERDTLAEVLADVPDDEAIRLFKEEYETEDGQSLWFLRDDYGVERPGGNFDPQTTLLNMDGNDFQDLIKCAFSGPTRDGKPAGVYITPAGGSRPKRNKPYDYELRGALLGAVTSRARN